ncbi:GNAT family N-acetyltransferase [Paenibacillus chartarius]|uniref:GNAT family N-acetyltransferase n=1 Tax=Paenibacillus chartarius TaxID=747481 RepID=A0ABV6DFD8_9BACL
MRHMTTYKIKVIELSDLSPQLLEELADLLVDVVADGASIGFLPPLDRDEARAYWKHVIEPGVHLWIGICGERLVGTVQLHLAMKPNGSHRAEIAKLMVHPSGRRNGVARMLMQAAENRAKQLGRSLLILDTRAGDPSNLLYRSIGYTEAGSIPNFARSADGSLAATVIYYKSI